MRKESKERTILPQYIYIVKLIDAQMENKGIQEWATPLDSSTCEDYRNDQWAGVYSRCHIDCDNRLDV